MQNGRDRDLRAKVFRVGGDGEHDVGADLEKQVVNDSLVLICNIRDLRGQREHDMKVRNGEQLCLPFGQPIARRRALTLRAVAIAAAVKGNDSMSARAVLAARDVTTECCSPAALDGVHHLVLAWADAAAVGVTPSGSVIAEDVRDFQR